MNHVGCGARPGAAHALVSSSLVASIFMVLVAGCAAPKPETVTSTSETPPDAAATTTSDPPELRDPGPLSGEWHWVRTVTPVEVIVANDPARYTLSFGEAGQVVVRADCNRGSGAFEQDGRSLAIGPVALTRMGCPPGSMDGPFVRGIDAAAACFMLGDTLMIDMKMDSGTMRFVRGG